MLLAVMVLQLLLPGLPGCASAPPAPGPLQEDPDEATPALGPTTAQGDPWLVGVSPSFLPNLGLTGTVARELGTWRGGGLAWEAEATQQFLDDTSFTDSENPSAGDWTQFKLGARWALPYDEGRWFTVRTGGTWLRARGEPNILNDPDDYAGVYVELGLEVRLGRFVVGPGIATFLVFDQEDREEHVVPQVTWRILYVP